MILNSPYISGSLTVTGNIIASGSVTISGSIASASYALTSSYAVNAELLDGLDSTVFVLTGSYNTDSSSFAARTTSLESTASILTSASASLDTRVGSLETTASILTSASASLSTASGSLNAGLVNVIARTGSFATTGSNVFYGNQTVSASMFVSGSITATGQIVAQTINVQSVTSSVVYSSGSNVFGNDLSNSQTFTGSMLVTGSVRVIGNACATGTGCFGVVCSPTIIIKGTATGATANASANRLVIDDTENGLSILSSTAGAGYINFGDSTNNSSGQFIYDHSADALRVFTSGSERLRICSNGTAVFTCDLLAKTLGTNDLILNNLNYECANYVDGTRGSWLIQEGACDLFIINQVSCKKYKFNLIEIE